jgi:hypothetical protein
MSAKAHKGIDLEKCHCWISNYVLQLDTCAKRNGITVLMTQFLQKYNNTNIITVSIPKDMILQRIQGLTQKFRLSKPNYAKVQSHSVMCHWLKWNRTGSILPNTART